MKVGFTGTQKNLSPLQFDAVIALLVELEPTEAHHGDCIGADHSFHLICDWMNNASRTGLGDKLEIPIKIVIHPPNIPDKRSNCADKCDFRGRGYDIIVLPEKPYLARNKDIVNASDVMICCPGSSEEQVRSGTWSTWRYAKKQKNDLFTAIKYQQIYLILPDGTVK